MKSLLNSAILATYPAYPSLVDIFTHQVKGVTFAVPQCEEFSIPHSNPFRANISANASSFQILSLCINLKDFLCMSYIKCLDAIIKADIFNKIV